MEQQIEEIKRIEYDGERRMTISPDEVEEIREYLTEFYIAAKEPQEEIQDKIDVIIQQCLYGWKNAPMDFDSRIRAKLGRNSLLYKKSIGRLPQNISPGGDKIGLSAIDFIGININPEEKKFLRDRERAYRKDYEFNDSSDLPLLIEILVDELVLKRLQQERVLDDDYSVVQKKVEAVQKRVLNNMESLGILRSQRIENDQNIEGNISQASVIAEKKLENIRAIKDPVRKEFLLNNIKERIGDFDSEELEILIKEIRLQREHDLEPPSNVIAGAELEKVMKELNVKGAI